MFMFDIETLGIESTSVILSFACIYFDPETKPTYEELLESAFFVKLDSKDQIQRLKRTVTKSTLDWWTKQSPHTQLKSLNPAPEDVQAEVALVALREWAKQFPDSNKAIVWARGNLDQMAIGSLENACKVDTVFHFGRWRDVRTAVDLLTGSTNGYCSIPGFDESKVIKHDPVHDCAYDAMMLMYGK
jgi:hypothetical protein